MFRFSPSYVAAQPSWAPTSVRWAGRIRRSSGYESPAVPRQGRSDGWRPAERHWLIQPNLGRGWSERNRKKRKKNARVFGFVRIPAEMAGTCWNYTMPMSVVSQWMLARPCRKTTQNWIVKPYETHVSDLHLVWVARFLPEFAKSVRRIFQSTNRILPEYFNTAFQGQLSWCLLPICDPNCVPLTHPPLHLLHQPMTFLDEGPVRPAVRCVCRRNRENTVDTHELRTCYDLCHDPTCSTELILLVWMN